eukprot:4333455-Pleurochrysis_carterae.AAC.1
MADDGSAKSFDSLMEDNPDFPTTCKGIQALPPGGCGPVLLRDSVGADWKQGVIARVDEQTFAIYEADGITTDGTTIPDGKDENGVPLDDCLEEEWDLTIKPAMATESLPAKQIDS